MTDGNASDPYKTVESEVAQTQLMEITPSRIDDIVLKAAGLDQVTADLFRAAEEAEFNASHNAYKKDEGPLVPVGTLAVIVAATAAGGVFGRYQSPGWSWMPPILAPIVVVLIAMGAVASFRGPIGRTPAGFFRIAFALVIAAGIGTFLLPGLATWELVDIVTSWVLGLAGIVWIYTVRAQHPDDARERDLAMLRARREGRAALAEERERSLQRLGQILQNEGADYAVLDALWAHAASCADSRGAKDLERVDGPVGASKLAATLDIPRDHHDRSMEQAEARWEAKASKR